MERIPDDSNVVICGLGVWIPLTTLLYCLEEGRSESLEQVVGLKQCDSQEAIQSVLTNIGHINALRLGVALWTRSGIDLKPEFVERFSLLKIGVLPLKSELDDWARKATDGIISEFPIELNPDTLLVLAAAISAKARGVKKVSRHFEPVKKGILIAPVINISAEIADQSAAIQSSQSFAPAPGMHRLTGDFADDGFIHGTSR